MQSDPPSTAASSKIPILPPELIHRVIVLALPRLAITNFKERYELLRAFSLVDQQWRELAQRELFRHVKLSHALQLRLFQAGIPGQRSVRRVETLRLSMGSENGSYLMDGLKLDYTGLQEVWVHDLNCAKIPSSITNNMRIFAAHSPYEIAGSLRLDATLPASSLRTLALGYSDAWIANRILDVFEQAPKLRHVIFACCLMEGDESIPFLRAVTRLAPCLTALTLDMVVNSIGQHWTEVVEAYSRLFSSLASIKYLDLTVIPQLHLSALLAALPSPCRLETLRLRLSVCDSEVACYESITALDRIWPGSLTRLEKVILPLQDEDHALEASEFERVLSSARAAKAMLVRRGMKVTHRNDLMGYGMLGCEQGDWERALREVLDEIAKVEDEM